MEELQTPLLLIIGEGFFGFIGCDLEAPQADVESGKWDELAPIFNNATINQNDITSYQRSHLINVSDRPDKPVRFEKRMLIDC